MFFLVAGSKSSVIPLTSLTRLRLGAPPHIGQSPAFRASRSAAQTDCGPTKVDASRRTKVALPARRGLRGALMAPLAVWKRFILIHLTGTRPQFVNDGGKPGARPSRPRS